MRPARSLRGFTLVELLLVVMVLGVLAGVAAPKYATALSSNNLEACAKRLAADLRRLRSTAVQTAKTCTIALQPATDKYESIDLDDPDHPGQTLAVSVAESGYAIDLIRIGFGGVNEVTFDWRGDPVHTGSIELWYGGRVRTVTVSEPGDVEVTP